MAGFNCEINALLPGEIKHKGYSSFVTDFIVKNQLLDKGTWTLFVNQFRSHTDNDNRWRGEYWGKMMRGAALCYALTKSQKLYAVLRDTVLDILSVAEDDGRISSYPREKEFNGWDMWGRKYVMLGLLYFYDICQSKALKKKIVRTLERHLSYVISCVGNGKNKKSILATSNNFGGLNSCSILEPVVKLYNLTNKDKYLKFATYIVKSGFSADGNFIQLAYEDKIKPYQYPHTKAYEMTSCFQGLLEYYKVVKDEKYLKTVLNFFNAVASTDLTIVGSSGFDGEFFDNSSVTQTGRGRYTEWENGFMQETCVTVTWMNLCYAMLCFTGEAKYAEYLENSALNGMYGAVNTEKQPMKRAISYDLDVTIYKKPRESFPFDSYSPLYNDRRGKGIGGFIPLQNGRSYGCCACIGSAGVAIAELYKVMKTENGICFNGYGDCVVNTQIGDQKIKIKAFANLYKSGKVKVIASGGEYKLAFRVPSWSKKFELLIDGKPVSFVTENGYAVVNGVWDQTVIEINLSLSWQKIELNGKVALKKGPIVLSRDARFGEDISLPVEFGNRIIGKRIANDKFFTNATYLVQTQNGVISMCDYSSAGKDFDEEESALSVWMDKPLNDR